MSEKRESLGQILLYRVKCLEGCSAEDLDKLDCLMVECRRSDGATRAIHRCVIEVGSEYFSQEIAKIRALRETANEYPVNVLRLDVTVEMFDIILEYLYTRDLPQITPKMTIETYAAVKRFGITDIAQHIEEFMRQDVDGCLEDEAFWDPLNYPADVNLLLGVLNECGFDESLKARLIKRAKSWCGTDVEKMKSVFLSTPESPTSPMSSATLPIGSSNRTLSTYRASPNLTGLDTTVALVGPRNTFCQSADWIAVSMPSLAVIWSSGHVRSCPAPNERSVVYNGSVYIPQRNKVLVRDLNTNELIREITTFGKRIDGVRVHHGEVFFHTRNEIYLLDAQGTSCTKIARVKAHLMSGFAILKKDSSEFRIAVRLVKKSEVRAYTFCKGCVTSTSSTKVQNAPSNMVLIGSHGGLLYFLAERKPYYYAAFRGNAEVQRHPVQNCLIVMAEIMCNGFLYLLHFAEESYKTKYVCGIDLNTDSVIFRKSCIESSLEYASRMIPVITNAPDCRLQLLKPLSTIG